MGNNYLSAVITAENALKKYEVDKKAIDNNLFELPLPAIYFSKNYLDKSIIFL